MEKQSTKSAQTCRRGESIRWTGIEAGGCSPPLIVVIGSWGRSSLAPSHVMLLPPTPLLLRNWIENGLKLNARAKLLQIVINQNVIDSKPYRTISQTCIFTLECYSVLTDCGTASLSPHVPAMIVHKHTWVTNSAFSRFFSWLTSCWCNQRSVYRYAKFQTCKTLTTTWIENQRIIIWCLCLKHLPQIYGTIQAI